MGRSQGTKETQGVNGDAAALQRFGGSLDLERYLGAVYEPCSYESHRAYHCVREDGPLICSACHPAPPGDSPMVMRGDPRFDELAGAARARMTGRRPRCAADCGQALAGTALDPGDPPPRALCAECAKRKAISDKRAAA